MGNVKRQVGDFRMRYGVTILANGKVQMVGGEESAKPLSYSTHWRADCLHCRESVYIPLGEVGVKDHHGAAAELHSCQK